MLHVHLVEHLSPAEPSYDQATTTTKPGDMMALLRHDTHHLRTLHAEGVHEKVIHAHERESPCQVNTLLQAVDDSNLIIQAEISDMQHDLVLRYGKRTFSLL